MELGASRSRQGEVSGDECGIELGGEGCVQRVVAGQSRRKSLRLREQTTVVNSVDGSIGRVGDRADDFMCGKHPVLPERHESMEDLCIEEVWGCCGIADQKLFDG